jgi:hypothetical protein
LIEGSRVYVDVYKFDPIGVAVSKCTVGKSAVTENRAHKQTGRKSAIFKFKSLNGSAGETYLNELTVLNAPARGLFGGC